MAYERRVQITDPEALEALAHPVRLDVLNYLMSAGPATASSCARAVDDTPSNCSYHLRVLAKHGLVRPSTGGDGRERPWEATVTGLAGDGEVDNPAGTVMIEASMQLDRRLLRSFTRAAESRDGDWAHAESYCTYSIQVSPDELRALTSEIDRLVRPYIAATREGAPVGSGVVHLAMLAVPRTSFS